MRSTYWFTSEGNDTWLLWPCGAIHKGTRPPAYCVLCECGNNMHEGATLGDNGAPDATGEQMAVSAARQAAMAPARVRMAAEVAKIVLPELMRRRIPKAEARRNERYRVALVVSTAVSLAILLGWLVLFLIR